MVKLTRLRQLVQRFTQSGKALQVLLSGNVEKALTFLDVHLLPEISNAVEHGNRRYRKMHKTICRVRTQAQIVERIALNMLRDAFAQTRAFTSVLLHRARAAPGLLFARRVATVSIPVGF